jgi:hypothetical protein
MGTKKLNTLNFYRKIYVGDDIDLIYGQLYEVCQFDSFCYVIIGHDKMKIFPDLEFIEIKDWRKKQIKKFYNGSEKK